MFSFSVESRQCFHWNFLVHYVLTLKSSWLFRTILVSTVFLLLKQFEHTCWPWLAKGCICANVGLVDVPVVRISNFGACWRPQQRSNTCRIHASIQSIVRSSWRLDGRIFIMVQKGGIAALCLGSVCFYFISRGSVIKLEGSRSWSQTRSVLVGGETFASSAEIVQILWIICLWPKERRLFNVTCLNLLLVASFNSWAKPLVHLEFLGSVPALRRKQQWIHFNTNKMQTSSAYTP